jgi:hypothetical protein
MNYSRRQLYALGEPLGESATRLKPGGRVYGGGGGGAPANPDKTTTTVELPEWARPYAKDTLAKGAALTDINQNPYQQYGGERIAGFQPMQQQAFQGAANMQPSQQVGLGSDIAGAAGIGALGTNYQSRNFQGGQFDNQAAQQYMNPYTQNVVDYQKSQALRDFQIAQPMRQAQAVQQGAFGGSRSAIVDAEAQRSLNSQLQGIEATGQQAAFQNAQQQYNTDQARRLQAQQLGEQSRQYGAGLGMQGLQTGLQAASTLGQLGQTQYGQQMGINQLQSQYGAQQQQQAQRPLDMAYQDFLNQQNYPYKQLGFMSDMIRGLPLGQQSTSSVYEQGPSTVQTLAGLGGAAYGFGKSGLFGAAEGGLMDSYAEGGEVKRYAGDEGSVTSQDNKDSIVEGMYSMDGLQKAKEAALSRRDMDTAQAIDERIAELNAIQAQSASINYGLGSAFDQIPEERQETMMAANGGIVAFAGGGTYKKQAENAMTELEGLAKKYPAAQTPEEYESAVTKRMPMVERIYGEDITKPYLEETKAKRAKLPEQMEKDQGLAIAAASLGLLSRKKRPGESQKNQLIAGLGEAGQQFAGEVGRLKKENREADDKLRQSEITLATAQQARREGLAGKAMGLEDKSRAEALDGYKTHMNVQEKLATIKSGLASTEMQGETSRYASDQSLRGQLASVAATREGHRLQASKPSQLKEGTDVFYAKLRPLYQDKSDEEVRAMAQQKYLEMTKTGMPGVEAKIAATREEKAREATKDRMTIDPIALKAAREKDSVALNKRRQEILREELSKPPEPEAGAASETPAQQPAQVNIPPQAIDMLKKNPTPDNRRYFDQTFGQGAAARALGQ